MLVAIARSVGLGEIIDRPLEVELIDNLHDRQMLLVLDNFEQVTEAASVVARLLTKRPDSRSWPRVARRSTSGRERVYQVRPLGVPPTGREATAAAQIATFEAVQLFVDRARSSAPTSS